MWVDSAAGVQLWCMTQHNFAYGTVDKVVRGIFSEELQHMQVMCLALVTFGAVRADRLGVAAVGRAMATGRGTDPKHGIKQVDRFLSNKKLSMEKAWPSLMRTLVGKRDQILVTMDWTDFDADDHTTLVISLVTRSRRAQPLVWKTVRKSTLAKHQSGYERELLETLRRMLPTDVRVIVLADRGFGSTALYDHMLGIQGFDFVVRFRACIYAQAGNVRAKASTLVPSNGRIRVLQYALLTADRAGPYNVVLYKARGMKDSWCLATSLPTTDGRAIVDAYALRFQCEEGFRDAKDRRFGMGLKQTTISKPDRRDHMLLLFALAYLILTLVGCASEHVGADRALRANTVRTRTHSLFCQGRQWMNGEAPARLLAALLARVAKLVSGLLRHGVAHAFR